jgi:hypothetical protein
MTIAAGTKLGSYEITGAIGADGMGEVPSAEGRTHGCARFRHKTLIATVRLSRVFWTR